MYNLPLEDIAIRISSATGIRGWDLRFCPRLVCPRNQFVPILLRYPQIQGIPDNGMLIADVAVRIQNIRGVISQKMRI